MRCLYRYKTSRSFRHAPCSDARPREAVYQHADFGTRGREACLTSVRSRPAAPRNFTDSLSAISMQWRAIAVLCVLVNHVGQRAMPGSSRRGQRQSPPYDAIGEP
jgi:hypothetical protein